MEILKLFFKLFAYVTYDFFFSILFLSCCHVIAKGLAMCWLGGMITTQKEHIINNNLS